MTSVDDMTEDTTPPGQNFYRSIAPSRKRVLLRNVLETFSEWFEKIFLTRPLSALKLVLLRSVQAFNIIPGGVVSHVMLPTVMLYGIKSFIKAAEPLLVNDGITDKERCEVGKYFLTFCSRHGNSLKYIAKQR